MPALSRATATLRFQSPDLDPDEITLAMGVQPDAQQRRNDVIPTRGPSGSRIAKFGMWRLSAIDAEPGNIDKQVEELLSSLNPDLETWRILTSKYKTDLFCGWFMENTNEGEDISSATLFALASRGITLSLDIYAPETDA